MTLPAIDARADLNKLGQNLYRASNFRIYSDPQCVQLVSDAIYFGRGNDLAPCVEWILGNFPIGKNLLTMIPALAKNTACAEVMAPHLGNILDSHWAADFPVMASVSMLALLRAARPQPVLFDIIEPRVPQILDHIADSGFAGNYGNAVINWYGDPDHLAQTADRRALTRFAAIEPSLKKLRIHPKLVGASTSSFIKLVNGLNHHPHVFASCAPQFSHMAGGVIGTHTSPELFAMAEIRRRDARLRLWSTGYEESIISINDDMRHADLAEAALPTNPHIVGLLANTLFKELAERPHEGIADLAAQAVAHTQHYNPAQSSPRRRWLPQLALSR